MASVSLREITDEKREKKLLRTKRAETLRGG